MCYSPEVSAGTFTFVGLVAMFLWNRAAPLDRPIALILLVVAAMQLIEFGIWLNLDCGPINKTLSAAIPLLLYAQPLLLNLIVWWYKASWAPTATAVTAAILLLAAPFQIWKVAATPRTCVTVAASGNHLQWAGIPDEAPLGILSRMLYYVAMLIPLVTLKDSVFAALYLGFSTLSLWRIQETKGSTWPSVWCHFVNFLAAFAVIRHPLR